MTSAPQIMGILNVTPDSFSDGGRHVNPVEAGLALWREGADIVDVGGESTRPGAAPVPPEEEQRRIVPVVRALVREGVAVSVDTRNASTMRAVLAAGAVMINDVSALQHDPDSAKVLAGSDCRVVLMHMRGTPETMAGLAQYDDVVADTCTELAGRVAEAECAGITRDRLMLDPGIGFAKTAGQNIALLQGLGALRALGLPILLGVSRKAFIGAIGGESDPLRRLPGSLAAALFGVLHGVAMLRVHDVAETAQALRVWNGLTARRS